MDTSEQQPQKNTAPSTGHGKPECIISGCSGKTVGRGYCDKHYRRLRRHGDPLAITRAEPTTGTLRQRLEAHTDKRGPRECWLWTGPADTYGHLSFEGKVLYAHRVAHEEHKGPIPEGQLVRHSCDTPLCVNPRHLRTGTDADNMRDKVEHGNHLHGERTPAAKLTGQQVDEIRAASGLHREIAARYGISRPNVSLIRAGKTWRNPATADQENLS